MTTVYRGIRTRPSQTPAPGSSAPPARGPGGTPIPSQTPALTLPTVNPTKTFTPLPTLTDPTTVTVTATATQTNAFQPSTPGICDSTCTPDTPVAQCQVNQWQSGTMTCGGGMCPSQPICSSADISVCPVFGGNKATAVSFTTAPQVQCTYNLAPFNSVSAIQDWQTQYGNDTTYNQVLMPYFCSQPSSNCGKTNSGITPGTCSRFLSNDLEGSMCRAWQNDPDNSGNLQLADSAMQTYCKNNPTVLDCGCINRDKNKVYTNFKQYAPINDGCWFTPCKTTLGNLVPSTLKNPTCPANFCDPIVKGFNETQKYYIPAADVASNIVCPIETPPNQQKSGGTSWWYILFWIVLLIFIGVLLYFALRKGRQEEIQREVRQEIGRQFEARADE